MEAYVHGVSMRKVDDLVRALGSDTGVSKSKVSRICAELDEHVVPFAIAPWTTARFRTVVRAGAEAAPAFRGGERACTPLGP
jgi:transposase-like protein